MQRYSYCICHTENKERMKKLCLLLSIVAICFFSCKKNSSTDIADNPSSFKGDGYIYTDGDPAVVAGGIGWFFAESRVGQWKALPLKGSELPTIYKPIATTDSIAVTVDLKDTNNPVGCDCIPGIYYYHHIISIKKR